eukprot:TRINITY_DN16627_c0_g1_i2.p1 TRINITY_DN16627_c0_g1~~TRINITY_DN16627_c0_g1_i2.p1  ORF type:complete len:129 (-),score=18.05 TRINITY_DN16627_c0_g1_i2:66-452(-)
MPSLVGSEMCIRDRCFSDGITSCSSNQISCAMSIQNAMSLLNTIDEDAKLRDRIFFCINSKKLMIFLSSQGYHFTVDELEAVSYTHLTLPTICSVQISVVAVSLKKKYSQNINKARQLNNKITNMKTL